MFELSTLTPEQVTEWLQPIVIAGMIVLLIGTLYKVRELRSELRASEERLNRRLDTLKASITASEAKMDKRLEALKAELKEEILVMEKKLAYVVQRLRTLEAAAQGSSQCPPHGRHPGWRRLGWRR